MRVIILCLLILCCNAFESNVFNEYGFVDLRHIDSTIEVDLWFIKSHNPVGSQMAEYFDHICMLMEETAQKLSLAQQEAKKLGYSLKVYDCYRPSPTQDYLYKVWPDEPGQGMKHVFFPDYNKTDLIDLYIKPISNHSTGFAVDVTLVKIDDEPIVNKDKNVPCTSPNHYRGNAIDMGTGYLCYHPWSSLDSTNVSEQARKNRLLLKQIMESAGFYGDSLKWWHFEIPNDSEPRDFAIWEQLRNIYILSLIICSAVSAITIFVMFGFVIFKIFNRRKKKKKKYLVFNIRLLVYLQIANLGKVITDITLWSVQLYMNTTKTYWDEYTFELWFGFCFGQYFQRFFNWAVFFWSFWIAFWLWFAVYYPLKWKAKGGKIRKYREWISHLTVWPIAALVTFFPFIKAFASGWEWCDAMIKGGGMGAYIMRIWMLYVPMWVLIIVVIGLYLATLIKIVVVFRKSKAANKLSWREITSEMFQVGKRKSANYARAAISTKTYSRLVGFPAVFIIIWLIPTIDNVIPPSSKGSANDWLTLMNFLLAPLHGFCNSVVFLFNPLEQWIKIRKLVCCEWRFKHDDEKQPDSQEMESPSNGESKTESGEEKPEGKTEEGKSEKKPEEGKSEKKTEEGEPEEKVEEKPPETAEEKNPETEKEKTEKQPPSTQI